MLARRGYSRDHRSDCKQVCIGLVVTREGIPLGYEVFAGNRPDVTTVEEIVATMERRYGQARRIWVMDRGMTSAENIAWLRGSRRRYFIGASKSELKNFAGPWWIGGTGGRCATGSKPSFAPARMGARRSFWCARPSDGRRNRRCTRASASASRPPWRVCQAPRARAKADRSRRHRAPDRAPARAQLARCRALRDPSRRRPNLAAGLRLEWSGAPNGTNGRATAKAATCCAPTSATGARGAVADLYPTYRSRGGLPHPQERAVDPSHLASARDACWPTSWCASSPTCCGRRWSNGRAAPVWATVPAPSSRNSPPSKAPTWSCRRRRLPAANCDCAASCAPIAPRRSCSIASDSACPSGSACPPPGAKCSANFGLST